MMALFLKKLKIELPYDLAIPLWDIYPEKNMVQKDTCTPTFIAALFTIAKTWRQPKCPSTEEWIKKMGYIHILAFLSFENFRHRALSSSARCRGEFPPEKGSKDYILEQNPVLSIVVTASFNNNKSFLDNDILLLLLLLLLLLSRFSPIRLCATPWTAAYQASPSMGFSRQEHWSVLPFPSP